MAALNREISLAHNLRRRSYSRLGFHIKAFSCKLRYVLSASRLSQGGTDGNERAPWQINLDLLRILLRIKEQKWNVHS